MLRDEIAHCEKAAIAAFTAYQSHFEDATGEALFAAARSEIHRAIALTGSAGDEEPLRRQLVATLAYFTTSRRSLLRSRDHAARDETQRGEAAALASLRLRLSQRLAAPPGHA